jgi:hypothetical protein
MPESYPAAAFIESKSFQPARGGADALVRPGEQRSPAIWLDSTQELDAIPNPAALAGRTRACAPPQARPIAVEGEAVST